MTTPLVTAPGRGRPSTLARVGWPIGIATILLLSAGSNIAVMFIAKSDPAFAIEPDYYRKAVTWDATMAQASRNVALGWTAAATLVLARPGEPGQLNVTLADAAGAPLTGARVAVEAMHNARASQRYDAALVETRPGVYTGAIDAHRPGAWELRLDVTRATDRFTHSLRLDAR